MTVMACLPLRATLLAFPAVIARLLILNLWCCQLSRRVRDKRTLLHATL